MITVWLVVSGALSALALIFAYCFYDETRMTWRPRKSRRDSLLGLRVSLLSAVLTPLWPILLPCAVVTVLVAGAYALIRTAVKGIETT